MPSSLFQVLPGFSAGNKLSIIDSHACLKKRDRGSEKGHYKYAGQWKHSRMHGCGVYELNGRQVWVCHLCLELELRIVQLAQTVNNCKKKDKS